MWGSPLPRNARPHSQEGHGVRGGEHGTESRRPDTEPWLCLFLAVCAAVSKWPL